MVNLSTIPEIRLCFGGDWFGFFEFNWKHFSSCITVTLMCFHSGSRQVQTRNEKAEITFLLYMLLQDPSPCWVRNHMVY